MIGAIMRGRRSKGIDSGMFALVLSLIISVVIIGLLFIFFPGMFTKLVDDVLGGLFRSLLSGLGPLNPFE